MVAVVFALLTPLWIPIDLIIFDRELGWALTLLRALSTLAFAALALSFRKAEGIEKARWALFLLLSVPSIFFMITLPLLGRYPVVHDPAQFVATSYAFLPFVMVAGLSMFPITAVEGVLLSIPLWLANLVVPLLGYQLLPFASHLGALWLLTLLAAVAILASMSQLHFMVRLVAHGSHDGLTRAYNRLVGEELLELQFSQAQRGGAPLALLFLDLDDFKQVNDRYGHDEGDNVLRAVADGLRGSLRRGDVLIRWGGEEFLVMLPLADGAGAKMVLTRLGERGLGVRPDGRPQTASIGVAERLADGCAAWTDLVELADKRMYAAKQGGKNRAVGLEETVVA